MTLDDLNPTVCELAKLLPITSIWVSAADRPVKAVVNADVSPMGSALPHARSGKTRGDAVGILQERKPERSPQVTQVESPGYSLLASSFHPREL